MVHLLSVLTLVVILIRPQDFVPGMDAIPVVQYLLVPALLAWLATDRRPLDVPATRWMFLFGIFAYVSVGMNGWWGGASQVFEELLPPFALYLLTAAGTRTEAQFRRFAWALCVCALVLVFHGHQQRTIGVGFTGQGPIEGNRIRYIGILGDPNDLGMLFSIGLALAAYLFAFYSFLALRLGLAAVIAAFVYGIYLTDSRGSMLACFGVVALVMSWKYGKVATISGLVLAVPAIWASTRLATVSASDDSAEGRVDAWAEGLLMLKDSPLFGVGFQGFTDYHDLTAHNSLILVMAETGILGYALWFSFLFSCGYLALAAMNCRGSSPEVDAEATAARYVIVLGFAAVICSMFLSQSYKVILFLVAGLAVGRWIAVTDLAPPQMSTYNFPSFSTMTGYAAGTVPVMWLLVRLLS